MSLEASKKDHRIYSKNQTYTWNFLSLECVKFEQKCMQGYSNFSLVLLNF
jgi:hypothetical protein